MKNLNPSGAPRGYRKAPNFPSKHAITFLAVIAILALINACSVDVHENEAPDVESDIGHPEIEDVADDAVSPVENACLQYEADRYHPVSDPASMNHCELDVEWTSGTCPIQDPGGFGDCAEYLGVVFDGSGCYPAYGCPCNGEDCPAFETLEECAAICADEGWCQEDFYRIPVTLQGSYICPGSGCGAFNVSMCISTVEDPTTRLQGLLQTYDVGCRCVTNDDPGPTLCRMLCHEDAWCCHVVIPRSGESAYREIDEDGFRDFCRLSLLPYLKGAGCPELP